MATLLLESERSPAVYHDHDESFHRSLSTHAHDDTTRQHTDDIAMRDADADVDVSEEHARKDCLR